MYYVTAVMMMSKSVTFVRDRNTMRNRDVPHFRSVRNVKSAMENSVSPRSIYIPLSTSTYISLSAPDLSWPHPHRLSCRWRHSETMKYDNDVSIQIFYLILSKKNYIHYKYDTENFLDGVIFHHSWKLWDMSTHNCLSHKHLSFNPLVLGNVILDRLIDA